MALIYAMARSLAPCLNHSSENSLLSEQLRGERECLTLGVSSGEVHVTQYKYVKHCLGEKKRKIKYSKESMP